MVSALWVSLGSKGRQEERVLLKVVECQHHANVSGLVSNLWRYSGDGVYVRGWTSHYLSHILYRFLE